jgi:hypothetical protein
MNAARDQLARDAEAQNPGRDISHHRRGWTGVRIRDQRPATATSLPGLLALISVVDTAGPIPAP